MRIRPVLLLASVMLAGAFAPLLAQAQNIVTPRVAPIRVEPTRPAGMPGAPREIAPAKSEYLMAVPMEEPRVVPPKKKKK